MNRAGVLVAALLAAGAAGCSLLLDWGDFSGGTADRDGGAESGRDDALAACGVASVCTPGDPSGWTGPVALYAAPTAAPACPSGAPVFDGFSDLTAPPSTCSGCACGSPSGVGCADPVMTFYELPGCSKPLGSPLTVTAACSDTPGGAFGAVVALPRTSGGSCAASGGGTDTTPSSWGTLARACPLPTASGPCAGGGTCRGAPPQGFGAQPCVFQAGTAGVCPAAYPSGPHVFYTGLDDTRGCAACACAAPSGGACTIGSPAVDVYESFGVCQGSLAFSFDAGSGCQPFAGPEPVKLVATPSLLDAGACAVADGGPTGAATPTGATTFCCSP